MKKREGTYRHAGPPRERMPECPQQYEVTIFGTQAVRKQQTAVDLIDKLPQDGRRKESIATVAEDIWCSSGRECFLAGVPSDRFLTPGDPAVSDDVYAAWPSAVDRQGHC
jgi:hypothetical protein